MKVKFYLNRAIPHVYDTNRGWLLREFDLGERLQTIMIEWSGREDKLGFQSTNETLDRDGHMFKTFALAINLYSNVSHVAL